MNDLQQLGLALVLIATRIGGFFSTFPLFRSQSLPRLVKVVLAISLSTFWLTSLLNGDALSELENVPQHWLAYGLAVGREFIIGAALGYLLALFFLPIQVAGAYLGQEIGFSMAGLTDPTTGATSNVMGNLLNALGMMVFLMVDGHQLVIGALYMSFERVPLSASLPLLSATHFTMGISNMHRWGFELAAPVGVGLFLVTVGTTMLMKISPQLNLFSVGIPVKLMLGLLIAFVFFPDVVALMRLLFVERMTWYIQSLGLRL